MDYRDIDTILILQDLTLSASVLSIMTDETHLSIEKMSNRQYSDKHEMKMIGTTVSSMNEKYMEFLTLGISKMVEDFFNNLKRYKKIELKIWSEYCKTIDFSKEVLYIRHLGNVIKHNNSLVESTMSKSAKSLVNEYGFSDETPLHFLKIFSFPYRDSILKHIYMAYEFCLDVLRKEGLLRIPRKPLGDDEIVEHMLKVFVHSIPSSSN